MAAKDQKLTLKYLKVEMDKIKEELNSTKQRLFNVENELNVAKEEIKSLKKTQKVDTKKHDKKDHKAQSIWELLENKKDLSSFYTADRSIVKLQKRKKGRFRNPNLLNDYVWQYSVSTQ